MALNSRILRVDQSFLLEDVVSWEDDVNRLASVQTGSNAGSRDIMRPEDDVQLHLEFGRRAFHLKFSYLMYTQKVQSKKNPDRPTVNFLPMLPETKYLFGLALSKNVEFEESIIEDLVRYLVRPECDQTTVHQVLTLFTM